MVRVSCQLHYKCIDFVCLGWIDLHTRYPRARSAREIDRYVQSKCERHHKTPADFNNHRTRANHSCHGQSLHHKNVHEGCY